MFFLTFFAAHNEIIGAASQQSRPNDRYGDQNDNDEHPDDTSSYGEVYPLSDQERLEINEGNTRSSNNVNPPIPNAYCLGISSHVCY